MLMRSNLFRELDRLSQQAFGTGPTAMPMPMDASRQGDHVVLHLDLPGVEPSSIDLTVEGHELTVSAERHWEPSGDDQVVCAERPQGRFRRAVSLAEGLDAEGVEASYDAGVLTVTIPVSEQAKPRRVEISSVAKAHAIEAGPSAA
ncbi:MAG TPA: Hsp20/alpha crystallin family protein [Acidimicrobiales bacterium]|jgi:HSP20 family protein|nr:Hsp20/alpha crystallin family protein [Acidimicrobiales bacterium]